jgi:hypothetical protein
MRGQRVVFWVAVGGVSLLANFVASTVADRFPNVGLAKFVAYTHKS